MNRFYISDEHTELFAAFSSPPNVFDDFELSGTASNRWSNLSKSMLDKARAANDRHAELHQILQAELQAAQDLTAALGDTQHRLTDELKNKDEQLAHSLGLTEALRQKVGHLQEAWQTQVKEMSEAARSERELAQKTTLERENQLLAQLRSLTRLMHEHSQTAELHHRDSELKMRASDDELARVRRENNDIRAEWVRADDRIRLLDFELSSRAAHWSGKLYRRAAEPGSAVGVAHNDRSSLSFREKIGGVKTASSMYRANPDKLLELSGEDFVSAVYEGVLGRPVDPSGLENYTSQLRTGRKKTDIVYEVANSVEGKRSAAVDPSAELVAFIQRCKRKRGFARFFLR